MKLELSISEAAMLMDTIQNLPSVKQEAAKESSWEPKVGEEILVSDDGDIWYLRIFEEFAQDRRPLVRHPKRGFTYKSGMIMPFDKSAIESKKLNNASR